MKLGRDFFDRDTRTVARDLLGKYLVRVWNGIPLAVRLTETEAYIGRMDKACHAYNYRRTKRTETLFAPPGTAYIYLIYGMYHCLNFVTEAEGEPAAVLIRGGEARCGTELMARNRFGKGREELSPYQKKNFFNGPGKILFIIRKKTDIIFHEYHGDRRGYTVIEFGKHHKKGNYIKEYFFIIFCPQSGR